MRTIKGQVQIRIPGYSYVGKLDEENSDDNFIKLVDVYTLGELEHIEITEDMLVQEKFVKEGIYINKAFISEALLFRTRDSVLKEILS